PYRIADLHIKQLGFKEIPRPDVELTGISGSSKLYQFMGVEEEQQESLGVCVGVQTADGQVVANGEVAADNSVAVGEEKELVANPSNWAVGRAFAQRLRASRKYQLRVRQTSCYCS
ncbi:unnamed protein product, partial [Pylaiella littoralis]